MREHQGDIERGGPCWRCSPWRGGGHPPAAAGTTTEDGGAPTAQAPTKLGEGRGRGEPDRLGRLRRGRLHGSGVDWVTRLREEDRLPGQRQDRQHLGRDGHADAHRRVRRRVGLGDATLRLIEGGDVAPVNTELVPNYKDIFPALKDQPHNTVDGVNYGIPHGRGPTC